MSKAAVPDWKYGQLWSLEGYLRRGCVPRCGQGAGGALEYSLVLPVPWVVIFPDDHCRPVSLQLSTRNQEDLLPAMGAVAAS